MDDPSFAQQVMVLGVVATAALDLWQRFVARVVGVPATDWALVGRWFSYLPRGRFVHPGIGSSEPVLYERAVGWIAHYVVGVIYAALYLALVRFVLGTGPTLATAVGFGVVTVIVPWFLMQPGMGLGVLARRAPRPAVVRAHSLSSHVAFGIGLFGASLIF